MSSLRARARLLIGDALVRQKLYAQAKEVYSAMVAEQVLVLELCVCVCVWMCSVFGHG